MSSVRSDHTPYGSPMADALRGIQAERSSKEAYLDLVVRYLRNWTDSQCVGVRILSEDGHIPYEGFVGFSQAFWEAENFLSIRCDQCACIRVLTRQWEPQDLDALSPAQSFYRNDLINWAADLPPHALERFRGKCIEQGFSSVAVIPILSGDQVIGAVHLADTAKGKYPLEVVELIEAIAPSIADGINHYRAMGA